MKIFLIIVIVLMIIFLIRGFVEPKLLTLATKTLRLKNLPSEFSNTKIMQISDLHACSFGKKNEKLIELVKSQKPDYLFITGDCVDRTSFSHQSFAEFLDGVSNLCPIFFSLGNHETWVGSFNKNLLEQILNEFEERNVIVIDDRYVDIKKDTQTIRVYGFSPSRTVDYKTVTATEEMLNAKLGKSSEYFNVLLAHEPQFFDAYEKWGADLVFSGHVHGGIIRLPFIGGLFSSDCGFFPKYDAGTYVKNKTTLFISRGVGCSHLNFRFLNKPEVNLITVVKEDYSEAN